MCLHCLRLSQNAPPYRSYTAAVRRFGTGQPGPREGVTNKVLYAVDVNECPCRVSSYRQTGKDSQLELMPKGLELRNVASTASSGLDQPRRPRPVSFSKLLRTIEL